MIVAAYIKRLLSVEEYSFSVDEIRKETGKTDVSIKRELDRLVVKGEIVSLRKGFFLIIPPKYSSIQKLPIQLYSDKLFKYLNRNYYIGLLSAAKFHGAGHQQVQRDYLLTEKPKFNDISKKTIDIRFFTTSNWPKKNIQLKKSDAGIYNVSSPALTIADLIHHQTKLGGINRLHAIIEELAEETSIEDLKALLTWYPNKSTLQRFGLLMEELGNKIKLQDAIFQRLNAIKTFPVLLSPKSTEKPGAINNKWKVSINIKLESDL